MLIEFRVENHRSLRDEQVLTLEAGPLGDESDARPRDVSGHNIRLLPTAVLYGANASGKSNVLSAIAFMQEAVLFSHRLWEPESGIPRSQFAWGDKRSEVSMFEVSFLAEDTKYEYGFSVCDEAVDEEWLFAWPNGRKQAWFERERDNFKFGEHLKGENNLIKEVTRPNALFLSTASQHQHKQLLSVYSWFRSISPLNVPGRRYPTFPGSSRAIWMGTRRVVQQPLFMPDESDEALIVRVRKLLQASDMGIVDVRFVDEEDEREQHRFRRRRVLLQHQVDDENSWLDLNEESQGTQTIFNMATPIFNSLRTGGLLLVDELESSLHPLIGLAIVGLFNNPETNPKNAQLLFTTHDTNLLGTTLGEPPLRRDQVWFTEKDKDGASRLYPLTDYKPRKAENLERGYLQGRYGAIPYLGDIAWITE